MSEHFIKRVLIKKFKCFDDFSSNGFQRVNLIGGKNNIGKTAFLEACYINASAENIEKFIDSLYSIKFMMENINILSDNLKFSVENLESFIEKSSKAFIETNIRRINYEKETVNTISKHNFSIDERIVSIDIKKISLSFLGKRNTTDCTGFIDNFGQSNSDIISNYSSVQKKDKEDDLNSILNNFDENIQYFKVIDNKPQCKINNKYLEISELGDGARHLVSIVTSLYQCEGGHLFIDEIDNGIHYTMLDDIFEIILTISRQLNVQVFASTHSRECIEAFNRMQIKLNDNNSGYFEMARNIKDSTIFMSLLDSKQLEYELSHQGRFRGE